MNAPPCFRSLSRRESLRLLAAASLGGWAGCRTLEPYNYADEEKKVLLTLQLPFATIDVPQAWYLTLAFVARMNPAERQRVLAHALPAVNRMIRQKAIIQAPSSPKTSRPLGKKRLQPEPKRVPPSKKTSRPPALPGKIAPSPPPEVPGLEEPDLPSPEPERPASQSEQTVKDSMEAFAVIVEKGADQQWKPAAPAVEPKRALPRDDKADLLREDDLFYRNRTPPIPREVIVLPVSKEDLGSEDIKEYKKVSAVFFIQEKGGEFVSDGNVYEIESTE